MLLSRFKVGNIYSSNNYGDYKIIEKIDSSHFVVEFLLTGFKRKFSYATMAEGTMRDPYYPIYYGVGYLGEIDIQRYKRELSLWRFMLARCHNKKHDSYKTYGEIGIYVCNEWLCFANFVKDLPNIDGYDEILFKNKQIVLDKDINFIEDGSKCYCLKNCKFVKQKDNFQEMLTRLKETTSSRYIGVTKLKDGKWQASISYNGKNVYIGRYSTEEEAHCAYNKKRIELYGTKMYCKIGE